MVDLKNRISGHGVAMITPFDNDLKVDFDSTTKVVDNLIDNKIDFLVVLGTTSESPTLRKEEKRDIIKHIISVNSNRVPLILGLGGNSTQNVLDDLEYYDLNSFDALLSVTPYYNKPSQKGLYYHYKSIAINSPLPIILYNVPHRTGVNISPHTVYKLANDFENIVGIKEASNDIEQAKEILNSCPSDFIVLSGDDQHAVKMISIGAKGWISVIGNAMPKLCSKMLNLALDGDIKNALIFQNQISTLIDMIFSEGNPTGIKALMNILELCKNNLRLPLVKTSSELYEKIREEAISNQNLF
ncbi:MAG: 4-hydroxy-tetrahydrodipicolinate synthase [Flavobacteriaceae bacterium]|nr:4-hydroxy-tetrahydrodipicolinate synthase [Flavobacteriaceae bacterium]|tara:strand:- start:59 stop:958 length:900 start_codon:yes stop_codon:yes gene_type:complete